jgi:hypothetical protein
VGARVTAAVLEVGSQVRFEDRSWTVVILEGARARLVDSDNSTATVLVNYLFAAPDFELVGAPRRQVPSVRAPGGTASAGTRAC